MEKLTLIKVGGKIVEEEETLRNLLNDFSQVEGYKVLVHGGGRSATKLAAQLGIESKMVGGRRITDADMLRVVTMVYGGLVNKNIVAGLQALGINALGLTGADMNLMRSDKRPVGEVDYGFVGDVKEVNADLLASLIHQDIVPVLAPLTHDKQGHMLNTNADTIAGEAAKALAKHFEVTLMFCFEKKGVLKDENDDESVIPEIDRMAFKQYVEAGVIQGGMIPKLENSFQAIDAGVKQVIITRSDKRPVGEVDYGFVGDVKEVNADLLASLIHQDIVPVLAPLTHDKQGHMLNTNADTIAGEAAKALAKHFEVTLMFCFEKKGVLKDENDDESVIPEIDRMAFKQYVEAGVIQGGMIPKLENSFQAIDAGVKQVIITQASDIHLEKGTRVF